MKYKIPNKVRISGVDYVVERPQDRAMSDGNMHEATFIPARSAIIIDGKLSESAAWSALWHEIMEVVDFRYELKLDHHVLTVLEAAITQILNDNF